MEINETKRKLALLAERTVMKMKDHIKRAGKYNTGQLYNSVTWKFSKNGIQFIIGAPYDKYVIQADQGGNPRPSRWEPRGRLKLGPPVKAIMAWMSTPHGKRAYANMVRTNKRLTVTGASIAISRSIAEKGIRPVNFRDPYINQLYNVDAFHELEQAFIIDMQKNIEKELR